MKNSDYFDLVISLPAQSDITEIVEQVFDELKDFHPSNLQVVILREVIRRVKAKVNGSIAIKKDYEETINIGS